MCIHIYNKGIFLYVVRVVFRNQMFSRKVIENHRFREEWAILYVYEDMSVLESRSI